MTSQIFRYASQFVDRSSNGAPRPGAQDESTNNLDDRWQLACQMRLPWADFSMAALGSDWRGRLAATKGPAMPRQFSFTKRHFPTTKAPCTSAFDEVHLVDTAAVRRNIFRSLPVPALLLDRHGVVRIANAEASTVLGEDAIGRYLGRCFVADPAGISDADRHKTMGQSGAAPSAIHLSGWMRLADSYWVAAKLRLERAPGLRHGDSHADVIALVHLQPQATPVLEEVVPVGSTVNRS